MIKLKRIGILILILVIILFIVSNLDSVAVKVPFLTDIQMPLALMLLITLMVGFLLGSVTVVSVKRNRAKTKSKS